MSARVLPRDCWFAAVYDVVNWLAERRLLGPFRARLVSDLGGRLLDLGAGTGANFPYYRAAELVVAADPDPYMLRRAVWKAAGMRPRVASVLCAAEALPFGAGSFDGVVATLVLCTVDTPDRALAEVRRVLRPSGRLSLIEHVRSEGWAGRVQDAVVPAWKWLAAGCHPNRRTEALVRSAGFTFDEIEQRSMGPSPLIVGVARPAHGETPPALASAPGPAEQGMASRDG